MSGQLVRWDYKVVEGKELLPRKVHGLKDLGAEGWELVAVTADNGFETFYLKRPVPLSLFNVGEAVMS